MVRVRGAHEHEHGKSAPSKTVNESNLETSDEGQEDEENIEKLVVVADKDSDTESVTTTSLALKDIRSKIEDLCPHIQIQKV